MLCTTHIWYLGQSLPFLENTDMFGGFLNSTTVKNNNINN